MPCRCGLFVSYPLPRQNVESCVSCILTISCVHACVLAFDSLLFLRKDTVFRPRALLPENVVLPQRLDKLGIFQFFLTFVIAILILDSFVTSMTFDARILQEDTTGRDFICCTETKLLNKVFRRRAIFQVCLKKKILIFSLKI